MSINLKPKEEPNGNISQVFNLNNFYKSNDYASKSDLLSYANLYTANTGKLIIGKLSEFIGILTANCCTAILRPFQRCFWS